MQLIKILLLLQLVILLNSCGPLAYKKTDQRKVSWDPEERVKKNIEEGKSFKLFDNERKLGTTYEFASSNELAIIITENAAPANSLDKPLTEKNAALNATNNADNPNNKVLNFIRLSP